MNRITDWRRITIWWVPMILMALAGCSDLVDTATLHDTRRDDPRDQFGRTYYVDGAGNWGFGVADVARGLYQAGYRGNVVNFRWSPTLNPALDQTIGRPVARAKGKQLGEEINEFLKSHPGRQVNLIALSAGTGVAVWALENLDPTVQVDHLILLGSSLSSRYDMRKALPHVAGGIWVYHSPNDMILQGPVRTLGTIDGQVGVDPAGIVGLRPPGIKSDKIHNIRWSPRYERWGWTGAHTDATSAPFVRNVLAKPIVASQSAPTTGSTPTTESNSWPTAGTFALR